MVKGLYTAYTGMIEEMRRMDVMTNNLANADTTGYKKEGTVNQSFDEQLARDFLLDIPVDRIFLRPQYI